MLFSITPSCSKRIMFLWPEKWRRRTFRTRAKFLGDFYAWYRTKKNFESAQLPLCWTHDPRRRHRAPATCAFVQVQHRWSCMLRVVFHRWPSVAPAEDAKDCSWTAMTGAILETVREEGMQPNNMSLWRWPRFRGWLSFNGTTQEGWDFIFFVVFLRDATYFVLTINFIWSGV